jgi:hypothetical protein
LYSPTTLAPTTLPPPPRTELRMLRLLPKEPPSRDSPLPAPLIGLGPKSPPKGRRDGVSMLVLLPPPTPGDRCCCCC